MLHPLVIGAVPGDQFVLSFLGMTIGPEIESHWENTIIEQFGDAGQSFLPLGFKSQGGQVTAFLAMPGNLTQSLPCCLGQRDCCLFQSTSYGRGVLRGNRPHFRSLPWKLLPW